MFLLWVLWVLPLGEKVPHIAFVCVWAKCVFSLVLLFFSAFCGFGVWLATSFQVVCFNCFLCVLSGLCVCEGKGRWLCSFLLFEAQYNTTEEGAP